MAPTSEPERRPVRNVRPSHREQNSSTESESDINAQGRKIIKKKGKEREVKRGKSSNDDRAEPTQYEAGPEGYKKIRNTGSLPHFNDWCTIVVDDIGKKSTCMVGAVPTTKHASPPMISMSWIPTLCNGRGLRVHRPFEPVGKSKPLPSLFKPACTFLHFKEANYIFMFGGFDVNEEAVSSRLIAIDLDDAQCGTSRQQLFIFGGRASYDKESLGITSYSIAEYVDYRWTIWWPGPLCAWKEEDLADTRSPVAWLTTQNRTQSSSTPPTSLFSYSSEGSPPSVQSLPTTSPSLQKRKRLSSPPREVVVSQPHVIIAGWLDYGKEDHIMPEM
ncbi:hypothetical protein DFS33DRAFT_1487594 [Desarmillaria ectypa]|nr:hypothetical protein DFS33DRAFT_1487594 [Desarmillaria ectypa]